MPTSHLVVHSKLVGTNTASRTARRPNWWAASHLPRKNSNAERCSQPLWITNTNDIEEAAKPPCLLRDLAEQMFAPQPYRDVQTFKVSHDYLDEHYRSLMIQQEERSDIAQRMIQQRCSQPFWIPNTNDIEEAEKRPCLLRDLAEMKLAPKPYTSRDVQIFKVTRDYLKEHYRELTTRQVESRDTYAW